MCFPSLKMQQKKIVKEEYSEQHWINNHRERKKWNKTQHIT